MDVNSLSDEWLEAALTTGSFHAHGGREIAELAAKHDEAYVNVGIFAGGSCRPLALSSTQVDLCSTRKPRSFNGSPSLIAACMRRLPFPEAGQEDPNPRPLYPPMRWPRAHPCPECALGMEDSMVLLGQRHFLRKAGRCLAQAEAALSSCPLQGSACAADGGRIFSAPCPAE